MPSPTPENLANLITFVRDLIGDASSEECDCAQEISDRQIIAALSETRERVQEALQSPYSRIPGSVRGLEWFANEGYFADDWQLIKSNGSVVSESKVAYADPLKGNWVLTCVLAPLYVRGYRYDPYQAAADLLCQLRIRKRGMVDTSEMGLSIKLSQALAVMESVEASLRRSARIGSITFSRSDVA
jgi:hypothetical protein